MSGVNPDQMYSYFQTGAVGTKEFRNWLAKYDEYFGEVRDPDVDNEIDRIARERAAEIEKQREAGGLRLVDKEGNEREV